MSIYKGEKLISGSTSAYPKPDWTKAVQLDHEAVYVDGYSAPSNGMIIGWFRFTNRIAILNLTVNSITIARATSINSSTNSEGNVQCPVNKGDYIKLENPQGSIGSDDIDAALYFVPYKEQ